MKAAVGFNPRIIAPKGARRVATPEVICASDCSSVATRRGRYSTPDRGLKPTATIVASLREAKLARLIPAQSLLMRRLQSAVLRISARRVRLRAARSKPILNIPWLCVDVSLVIASRSFTSCLPEAAAYSRRPSCQNRLSFRSFYAYCGARLFLVAPGASGRELGWGGGARAFAR